MKHSSLLLLQRRVRSTHSRIVTCGILVCLCYLPTWLSTIVESIVQGSSATVLNFGFIYLGFHELWRKRRQLALYQSAEEDRLLGYLLILSGSAIFPLFLSSVSLQALLCLLILLGIVICTWGLTVFRYYLVPLLLLLVSVYPRLVFAGDTLRMTLTANRLESWMAWLGSLWFQALGQAAVAQGQVLSLSTELIAEKSVKVGSGCSGFDMAFVLAGMGLMLGLWFQQPWLKTALLIVLGMTLALVFNVPRIMLLAIAVVYWGQASFDFWHEPIGGQIFSTLLLTFYYYGATALIHR